MPGSLRVAIIGDGIGGLTAALALRARGLDVAVFEQSPSSEGDWSRGLSIHANAARLLKRVRLDGIGSPISGITLRTSLGEPITTPAGTAAPAFSKDGQGYNVHRADFLNVLFDALPKGMVTLGSDDARLHDVIRL
jgi:salicylate hydroxylase